MSQRSTTTCEHECRPRDDREWVPDEGKQTTVAATTETCRREPVEGHDYCAFHLPPDERPEDITPSAQLQDRLDQLASGAVPASDDRYTTYQGAYFDEIDLSDLDLEALSGQDVTLDFSYSRVAGGVTVTEDATIPITVAFRFVSIGSLHVEGATIRELNCTGASVRGNTPTKSVGTNKTVEILGDSAIQTLLLPEVVIEGETLISGLESRSEMKLQYLSAGGKTHISDINSLLLNLDDARIEGLLITDTADLNQLSADQVTADRVQLQDVTVEEKASLDNLSTPSARVLQLTAAQFTAQPPRVSELQLQNLEVQEEFDISVDPSDDETLDSLTMRNCQFETRPVFDRLTLEEGTFKHNDFKKGASFKKCEIEDATFESSDGSPLFGGDVSFRKARLPKSEFEQSDITVAGDINCKDAVLSGASLNEFKSTGKANFTMADLTGARLLNADLSNAILEGALLNRARLTGANLNNAYLYQATLGNVSIDSSTNFGLPVVYDPESHATFDSTVGLQNDADRRSRAMEAYMNIHNITRESGQSAVAIDAYKRRQQARTTRIKNDPNTMPPRWLGWKMYGIITGYGVGVTRLFIASILTIVTSTLIISISSSVTTSTPLGETLYAIAGFVGVALPYQTSGAAQYVLAVEAIFGAFFIALFVNALGRRSSM